MKVTDAIRILVKYGMDKSSCGKLPDNEHKASIELKRFIKDLKEIETIDELKEMLNERL